MDEKSVRYLELTNGKRVSFHVKKYDILENILIISLELSNSENYIMFEAFNSPELYSDCIVEFQFQNFHYTGKVHVILSYDHNVYLSNSSSIFKILLHGVKLKGTISAEGRLLFYLPNIQCHHRSFTTAEGRGFSLDHTNLRLNNREWIIRDAYEEKDLSSEEVTYKPYDLCAGRTKKGMFLETRYEDAQSIDELTVEAEGILHLISFAFGLRVPYHSIWIIDEQTCKLLSKKRNIKGTSNWKSPTICEYENESDHHFFPSEFLQLAYSEYGKNKDWWMKNITWYLRGKEPCIPELKELIEYTLIDRLSQSLFYNIFGVTPHKLYTLKGKNVLERIKDKLQHIKCQLTHEKELKYIDFCIKLTENFTYLKRNKIIFQYAGYFNIDNIEAVLTYRNPLIHEGELDFSEKSREEIEEHVISVSKYCLLLLLSLLGYDGVFYVGNKKFSVKEELPNWESIRLSRLKDLAVKFPVN